MVRAGEAAYTTGDWWLGEPEAWRTSKSGGRVVRAWKSVAGELWCLEKLGLVKQLDCGPGKAEVEE